MIDIVSKIKKVNEVINTLPGLEKKDNKKLSFELNDLIFDTELKEVVLDLFNDGHYARAVEEAYKFLNNLVKNTAKLDTDADGSKLMKLVFSSNNPIIMINSGLTHSENDEQLGYMEIFSGCMTGIRNPRAHEHELVDTKENAIQLIIFADHLTQKVRKAKVKQI